MKNNFLEAIKNRRSYYGFDKNIKLSNKELKELVDYAMKHVPSAFNSQSTRIVLLVGEHHEKLWSLTKQELAKKVSAESLKGTEAKIDISFASGYGTILFFEDQTVVDSLVKEYPSYADSFPIYSHHTSAMHQFALWTMLREQGIGASLQHYSPLIDEAVAKEWKIDSNWKLIAQMPFGNPICDTADKSFEPLDKRSLLFE